MPERTQERSVSPTGSKRYTLYYWADLLPLAPSFTKISNRIVDHTAFVRVVLLLFCMFEYVRERYNDRHYEKASRYHWAVGSGALGRVSGNEPTKAFRGYSICRAGAYIYCLRTAAGACYDAGQASTGVRLEN